jgi:glucose-6-phosphate 1-dehydrogenase
MSDDKERVSVIHEPVGEPAVVQGAAFENGYSEDATCLIDGPLDPCTIVIFGASGDLAGRKLIPALYNLFINQGLPDAFLVVGAARTEMSDEAFREKMREAIERHEELDASRWSDFAGRLHYQQVIYDDLDSYHNLGKRLDELSEEKGTGGNRIFNCAIPPKLYGTVATHLGRSGLSKEDRGWVKLVVEKPFGHDLASAIELDQAIASAFDEHQVYRIDHYLAKETVQNVLLFRFANAIFEPLWNRNFVDHVVIMSTETLGVEHRAGYYENAGVLRDMFQNHMMQLLALIAMEPPSRYGADRVRDEKTKAFRSLRPFPVNAIYDHLVLGQYGEGAINDEAVQSYRGEPKVADDSLTPTFALMRCFVDNWRWQGVPFYLVSGKRLKAKRTRMVIQFKEVPHSLFRETLGEHISANKLTLGVHPDEDITLTFQTKNPGARLCLRSVKMLFDYMQGQSSLSLDAYEKALLDCMLGDHMLFWRQDGIELTWAYLDPVLRRCETCDQRAGHLHVYPSGSWGPQEASRLLPGWPELAQ